MYQPNQIRNLPTLSDDEKAKYETGLQTLWQKVNTSAPNSPDQLNARQKIIDFSKMLITKIQQRRHQQSQHLQQQAQQQAQQQQGQQQAQTQQAQQAQQAQQLQQAQQAQQNQQQAQPRQQAPPQVPNAAPQGTPQTTQQGAATNTAPPGAAAAAAAAGRPNPQAAAAQRVKIPEHIMNHVNKMSFRPTTQITEKTGGNASKWVEEMKERYGRALMTMESSKQKIAQIDKLINDRNAAGNPFKEEEMRQLSIRKDQQMRFHQDAHKWVESVRRQHGGMGQAAATATAATQPPAQGNAAQATATGTPTPSQNNLQATQQNNTPTNTQNAPTPVNAGIDAAQKQAQMATTGRPSPAAGTPNATQQQPSRPVASVQQPPQAPQVQPQTIKTEPGHPAPINAAMAAAASQGQSGTSTPGGRVQTPQAATPTTTGGPARALSHSAAMNIANQRAAGTPGVAPMLGQQSAAGTPASAGGAVNQGIMGSGVQQQQGHPHAHPTQPQQATLQSKMPIPKQLPERATTVPQGVAVGGGVNTGRPTMTQGSGTLGGVMNQPTMNRIPAYNHEAEGDHVLSKKKLDELVRQVCGGSAEGQDGNLLTPEVEEVNPIHHSGCQLRS